jgi:hypothetical protein
MSEGAEVISGADIVDGISSGRETPPRKFHGLTLMWDDQGRGASPGIYSRGAGSLSPRRSAEAEKARYRHHNHDQADEIDDAVHDDLL